MARRSFIRLQHQANRTRGFTLIEMLVIIPIALITIATLIGLMVSLIGDVSISRERASTAYGVQDALDRIEQDARVATLYMSQFSLVTSPQGRDGGTGAFQSSPSGDIILSQYATSSNPYDPTRTVVYYANQPNPCTGTGTTSPSLNRPLTVRTIYFATGPAGNQTLWRRTIVPPWSTTATDTTQVCSTPWQRDNCPAPVTINATCQAADEKILDNVSSFATTYYDSGGNVTTTPESATSLRVSLTQSQQVAGETITTSGVTRASHVNVTTDIIPSTPNVYIYNPTIDSANNPILTTFAWDAVPSAGVYSVNYQIVDSGGVTHPIVNAPDQTGTQFAINDARPNDDVYITVVAKNDMGASSPTTYHYKKPIWTTCNLQGTFTNYGGVFAPASYTLTTSNMLIMEGLVNGGTPGSATTICTLPPGLRPTGNLVFGAFQSGLNYGVPARIDAHTDGTIVASAPLSANWITMDNVKFLPTTANISWTSATLQSGWTNYGGIWQTAQYAKDNVGRVHTQGIIKPGTQTDNTAITTLTPSSYAQSEYLHLPIMSDSTVTYSGTAYAYNAIGANSSASIVAKGLTGGSWESIQQMYLPTGAATWSNITLQNGWSTYAGYSTPQYTRTSDGVVTIKGLIKNSSSFTECPVDQVIGSVGAANAPRYKLIFMVASYNTSAGAAGFARVDIDTNGAIECVSGNSHWVSLDNIRYFAG